MVKILYFESLVGGAGVIVNHEMRFNLNKRPRKRNRSSPTQSKSNKKVKKPISNETVPFLYDTVSQPNFIHISIVLFTFMT